MDTFRFAIDKNREILNAHMVHHDPGIFRLNPQWRTLRPPHHLILYHVRGVRTIRGDRHTYSLDHDDVCLFFKGETYEVVVPKEPYHQMAIWFAADKADRIEEDRPLAECRNTFSHIHLPAQINVEKDVQIKCLFDEIIHLSVSRYEEKRLKASILLNNLFCELLLRIREVEHPGRQIEQVITYIERHLSDKMVVNKLAAMVGMSRRSLIHKFKRQTGRTMIEYQQQVRINLAASLLKTNPELPMKAIAHHLGFYDQYYFSKTFRRFMGRSPRAYRAAQARSTAAG